MKDSVIKRILVVDDDAAIRRLVATVLRRENYRVDTANGGRDALAKILLTRYDVVVLDLMMPEVSGLDVLKGLEARDSQTRSVVIMSAGSSLEAVTSISPSVFVALPKPFDIESLITAVGACVEAAHDPAAPPNRQPFPRAA
jgi:DNA-binding NtrC family response regulator